VHLNHDGYSLLGTDVPDVSTDSILPRMLRINGNTPVSKESGSTYRFAWAALEKCLLCCLEYSLTKWRFRWRPLQK
jgi:hypothetical protein